MTTSKTAESKVKAKFRQTSAWKNFRKLMKKKRKLDFLTQKPLIKGFQLHHLDESVDNYKKLEPNRFVTLNRNSHTFIHWIERYDWEVMLLRIASVLFKMDQYQVKSKSEQQLRVAKKLQELISSENI